MKLVIVGLFKLGLIFYNKKCKRLEDYFVTNPIYRKAILFIANSSFVEEDTESLLSVLLDSSTNLEALIQQAKTMTYLVGKLSLSSIAYVQKNLLF